MGRELIASEVDVGLGRQHLGERRPPALAAADTMMVRVGAGPLLSGD
jgi:hypothetical protein